MLSKIIDKIGTAGVWMAALSCTACFPALGTFAAALGLGFLSRYEGIAINTLIPIFSVLALIANGFIWYVHRHFVRGLLGIIGPTAVLFTLYLFWSYAWSTYLFYIGLILMIAISILDVIKPVKAQQCRI